MSIDLVSAKWKTKVNWLISFHSFIRQCFNILIRHCNSSRIRNLKIKRSKQLYNNNTLLFLPLPNLGQWMWRQLSERIVHSQHCINAERFSFFYRITFYNVDAHLQTTLNRHCSSMKVVSAIPNMWLLETPIISREIAHALFHIINAKKLYQFHQWPNHFSAILGHGSNMTTIISKAPI